MNEHWTTDPPEVGKRYWWTWRPIDSPIHKPAISRVACGNEIMRAQNCPLGYIRSRSPIPDPQPPPLPSGDEKERQ